MSRLPKLLILLFLSCSLSHIFRRGTKDLYTTCWSTSVTIVDSLMTACITVLDTIAMTTPICRSWNATSTVWWLPGPSELRWRFLQFVWVELARVRTFLFLIIKFVWKSHWIKFYEFEVVCNQESYSPYSFKFLLFISILFIYLFFVYFMKAFYYPPNVGYNIGTEDSPNSYMLEIHYDNPKGIEGHYVYLFIFKITANVTSQFCKLFRSAGNDLILFGNGWWHVNSSKTLAAPCALETRCPSPLKNYVYYV